MALTRTHRQVACRLLPQTRANWHWLETTLEAQRQPYNAALEERIDFHRKTGKSRTYFDQCKALTACRRELPEMAECAVGIQRGTLKRLDESFKGFFNRLKKGAKAGFPKFRGRRFLDSITIVSGVKLRDGTLHIPGFGPMTIRRKGGPASRRQARLRRAQACRRQADRRRLPCGRDRGACRQRTRARPRPELRTGRRRSAKGCTAATAAVPSSTVTSTPPATCSSLSRGREPAFGREACGLPRSLAEKPSFSGDGVFTGCWRPPGARELLPIRADADEAVSCETGVMPSAARPLASPSFATASAFACAGANH
ncbi:MAG: transposase [Boseongicola sp. SB0665_bin_10]|nr:transposase [Boseongicola sp. SB0665_bin_10]